MNWDVAHKRLRELRDGGTRCSEEILDLYLDVLSRNLGRLGDELWLVYEQVCIAACDCSNFALAQECIDALSAQFHGSTRVSRLQGLMLEAQEEYEDALIVYNDLLKNDPTNALIRKRKVSILKAQNKINEAIKELNHYLNEFMSDHDAWNELCDLYLSEQEYDKAAFCMEELIMFNPHNHLFHQKYAEIKYTQGGWANMELARAYFAQAYRLNSNNIRVLYGLFMAASVLAKMPGKGKQDSQKYATWAAEQISEKYKAVSDPKENDSASTLDRSETKLLAITNLLESMQLNQSS